MDRQFKLIALSRALFAVSTLLILVLNNDVTLFGVEEFGEGLLHNLGKYNFFYLMGQQSIFWSKLIACVILFVSIIGVLPRYTILLQLWVQWSFINSSISIEGGDQVAYLVTLFLTPIFILDSSWNMWRTKTLKITKTKLELIRFCLNLIKIQAVIIYFIASVGKYSVEQWLNGTSLYYWFIDPTFGMPDYLKLLILPLLTNGWFVFIGAWVVLILELSLSTGLFIKKKYKRKLFMAGVAFHFSIFLVHGLPNFMISMIGLLIIYLLVDYKRMETLC